MNIGTLPDTIQLVSRNRQEIATGAAPFTLYVGGDFWCTCENLREAEEEIAELLGRDAP